MGEHLEVALLGATAVVADGVPRALGGAPQRTLVARLALAPERTVSDAALLDALWPGGAPANAQGNLQSYVSRLRRVVGADVIARDPMGYRLALDPEHIDIVRFERLVAAADYAGALDLWRGEPFADVAEPLAFAPERARLVALHQRAQEGWLTARVDAGDLDGVLPELERAVAGDPLAEAPHLLLVRTLHLLGRTPDALRAAADLRRRVVEETGLDPSPALAELEQRILADDPSLRPAPSASAAGDAERPRLAPADRFVGRVADLDAVTAALDDHRVVTVVGPGGTGKTRLVQELLDRGAVGPALLVELAPVAPGGEVADRVATALGLQAAPEGIDAAVRDALAHRRLTLVLDNCEHVLAATRDLVELVLGLGPELRVLATSRTRLGVAAERVLRLGPLATDEQVELFCERAALLRSGFALTSGTRPLVRSICRQLDGLPLALELAARREAVFGLAQLDAQLADALDVIEPGDDERGRGVTSAVGWSYRLLGDGARALFDRLAVCQGGFSLDAVDWLCPPGEERGPALLAELVDASLVDVDLDADPPRYRLPEPMRRVALGHLDAAGLADARRAHRGWMRAHMEACRGEHRMLSARPSQLLDREAANVVAALTVEEEADLEDVGWLAALAVLTVSDAPRLEVIEQIRRLEPWAAGEGEPATLCALGCGAAAWVGGDTVTGRRFLDRALAGLEPGDPRRWMALLYRISNAMFEGDRATTEADAQEVIDDPAAPGWVRATAIGCAALINLFGGDRDAAERWMAPHEAFLDEVARVDGFVAYTRGEMAAGVDPEAALAWFDRGHALSATRGQSYNREICGVGRAAVLVRLDRGPEAAAACASSIAATARAGMWPQTWTTLRLAAELLVPTDPALAGTLLTAADHDPLASEVLGLDRARHDQLWAEIEQALGVDGVERARARGRGGDRATVVGEALDALRA